MVLGIDFVFEDDTSATVFHEGEHNFDARSVAKRRRRGRRTLGGMPRRRADVCGSAKKRCYIASIYYSPSGRGGQLMQYASNYMRMVQKICNRDMNFFPTALAMCVYGDKMRVYARDVGSVAG